jgi:AraC-like DNA-binding protein
MFFLVLRLGSARLLNLSSLAAGHLRKLAARVPCRQFRAPHGFHEHFVEAVRSAVEADRRPEAAIVCQMHVMAILVDVFRMVGEKKPVRVEALPTSVSRILKEIRERPERKIAFTDLVRRTGLAPSTLRRHVYAAVGEPVMDYVQRCRVNVARERLLAEPALSITRLAMDMGFSSSQHFATVCRRFTGLSPTKIRSQAASGSALVL